MKKRIFFTQETVQTEEGEDYAPELGELRQAVDMQPIITPTELGETLKEINLDNPEPDTGMSTIDTRSRLHYIEIPGLLIVDTLVSFDVLSPRCLLLTRQKKRLSVSLNGLGRQEMVNVAVGKRASDERKSGFIDNIKQSLGMGGGQN